MIIEGKILSTIKITMSFHNYAWISKDSFFQGTFTNSRSMTLHFDYSEMRNCDHLDI